MHMRCVKTWFTGTEVLLIEDTLVGEIDLSLQAGTMALIRSPSGRREAVLYRVMRETQQIIEASATAFAVQAWIVSVKKAQWREEPTARGAAHQLEDLAPNWGWDPGSAE